MRIFGLTIERTPDVAPASKAFSSINENSRGWFRIFESFPGAWQRNVTIDRDLVLTFHAVYACMTLIAGDIAKLRPKLVNLTNDGVWIETDSPAFSPVLRKPNKIQNRIQFWENWILSKLIRGNTYVLKIRDNRSVVTGLIVLDPQRVTPLISDDGDVYYSLDSDNIAGVKQTILVPANEIIHDRMNCLFHPLVGVSPIVAAGIAAQGGINIQKNALNFFGNKSQPGGILTTPSDVPQGTIDELKTYWQDNFTGEKAGNLAVVGGDMKYHSLAITAHDAQMIEHGKWSAEIVCSTFHVPPYKIGLGTLPNAKNTQALNVEYYQQCLQILIESAEVCLDEGLGLGPKDGVEFDLDGLLRMDTVTQFEAMDKGVKAGVLAPNEGRRKLDLAPVAGGESPYLQQQNYSLSALAKRDAREDPFASAKPAPATDDDDQSDDGDDNAAEDDGDPDLTDDTVKVVGPAQLRAALAA